MTELREKHISAIDSAPEASEKAPVDLGDSKSVAAKKRETKTETQLRNEVLRRMMGEEDQRRWFHDFLAICGVLRNPFSADPYRTAFSCGELNIGQQVFLQLQDACPDLYLKMMEEANATSHS